MNRDHWAEVEALFAAALAQPADERESFVRSRASSTEVAREVVSLLAAHLRSGIFDPLTARQEAKEEQHDLDWAAAMGQFWEELAGRYGYERELAAGGMATVHLARDLKHQRRVAIKVLRPALADAIGHERFLREITTTANLRHPHILPLYDSGEAAGLLYYVMPYVEGESLRDRLAREKQLPLEDALRITREVADALGYAHDRGVVHRDIKPENILLESGHAVVADFGIARALDAAGGDRLTETGITVGTPAYMSPEQASGERALDGRTDLYALGCVLYEMLAGQPPFKGPTAASLVHQHLVGTPTPVTQLRPAVPAHVAATLTRLLAKTPADRLDTGAQLVAALQPPLALGPPPPAGPRRSRRSRWAAAGGGLAILTAVVALLRFGPWGHRHSEIESLAVLPFDNQTGDPADNYFVDGVHEALIAELSRFSHLRVISRTSVLGFRGTTRTVPEIARRLNVDALIEGSVLRAGDSVQIRASLIDAATDRTVRTVTYVRDLRNVLGLLHDVTRGIAGQLAAAATPGPDTLVSRPLVDPAAYEAYLQARYLVHDFRPDRWKEAARLYTKAIGLDSTFALARAGLAETFFLLGYFGVEPRGYVWREARETARQAIALDADASEAYTTLGYVRLYADWDWDGAETALLQALRLDPNDALARHGLADLLTIRGRREDGLRQVELGREADPLSTLMNATVVGHLYIARRFEDAITEIHRLRDRFQDSLFAQFFLDTSLWQLGRYEEAWREFRREWSRSGDPRLVQAADRGYAAAGPPGGMRAVADYRAEHSPAGDAAPSIAEDYARAGAVEQTLRWLERAYRKRVFSLPLDLADPVFDPLRSAPRFRALAQHIGVPPRHDPDQAKQS